MGREEDRILEMIMRDKARGEEIEEELKYDPTTRTVRGVSRFHDPDGGTKITPEDATLSGTMEGR